MHPRIVKQHLSPSESIHVHPCPCYPSTSVLQELDLRIMSQVFEPKHLEEQSLPTRLSQLGQYSYQPSGTMLLSSFKVLDMHTISYKECTGCLG